MPRKALSSALPPVVADSPAGAPLMPAGAFFLADEDRARIDAFNANIDRLFQVLTGPVRKQGEPTAREYYEAIAALAAGDREPLEQYMRRGGQLLEAGQ